MSGIPDFFSPAEMAWINENIDHVRSERRNRQTGTVVTVIDNRDGWYDEGGPKWFNECVDHGHNIGHDTRALAESFAASPLDWCPICQESEGGE